MNDTASPERIDSLVRFLSRRWQGARRGLLRPVFPLLAKGQPVSVRRLAGALAAEPGAVREALEAGRAGFDADGDVKQLFGLTLDPTLHRVAVEGKVIFSCCALVCHMTPRLLGGACEVESVDPISREVVRLSIDDQGIQTGDPADACATLVAVDGEGPTGDVQLHICRHVLHFASRRSAEAFARRDPRRFVVTLKEFHEVAKRVLWEIWDSPLAGAARTARQAEEIVREEFNS